MVIEDVVSTRDLIALIDEYFFRENEYPEFIEMSERCFDSLRFEAESVCDKIREERERLEKMKIKTISTFQGIEIRITNR